MSAAEVRPDIAWRFVLRVISDWLFPESSVAITWVPSKFKFVLSVNPVPLFWITCLDPPPPEAAIVTVSVPALVVRVTFDPAASVKVSVELSATTLLWPETAIVWNLFPLPPTESAYALTAADVGIVVSLSFDPIVSDSVTKVPAAIWEVVTDASVANAPNPSVVLCAAAFASSNNALPAAVKS